MLIFASSSFAEELPPVNVEKPLDERALEMANELHDIVSEQIIDASNMLDNFFVQERMEDESSRSRIVFGYLTTTDKHSLFAREFFLRLNLHLPKTQNRLRFVVQSSVGIERDEESGNLIEDVTSDNATTDYSTALQYIFSQTALWQVSSSAGIRFSIPVDPYVRFRLRRLFNYDPWNFRLVQSFLQYTNAGFSETTSFDAERFLNSDLFFRASFAVSVADELDEPLYTHSGSLFKTLSKRRVLVYSVGSEAGLSEPAAVMRNFVNLRFRHMFYKNWAFYELVPEISFPRDNRFKPEAIFKFKLDIVVGRP